MFKEEWLCRNEACSAFWNLPGPVPDLNKLTYSDEWLQESE